MTYQIGKTIRKFSVSSFEQIGIKHHRVNIHSLKTEISSIIFVVLFFISAVVWVLYLSMESATIFFLSKSISDATDIKKSIKSFGRLRGFRYNFPVFLSDYGILDFPMRHEWRHRVSKTLVMCFHSGKIVRQGFLSNIGNTVSVVWRLFSSPNSPNRLNLFLTIFGANCASKTRITITA